MSEKDLKWFTVLFKKPQTKPDGTEYLGERVRKNSAEDVLNFYSKHGISSHDIESITEDPTQPVTENPQAHQYRMLDRLRCDCDYFLGNGAGHEKHLWAGTVERHIAEMRKLYALLKAKPEWLTKEEIDGYEIKMLEARK